MIEAAVLNGIRTFLDDKPRRTQDLHLTGGHMKRDLAEGSRLGQRILEAGPVDQRGFLLDVVDRIEIGRDRVSILLRTRTLRPLLSQGNADTAMVETAEQGYHEFRLERPIAFKRRGVEMKLVLGNDRAPAPSPARRGLRIRALSDSLCSPVRCRLHRPCVEFVRAVWRICQDQFARHLSVGNHPGITVARDMRANHDA